MRRSCRPSPRTAVGVAVTLLMLAGSCSDDRSDDAEPTSTQPAEPTTTASVDSTTTTTAAEGGPASPTDIEFLMPSALPPGWTIGWAVQRIEASVDADGQPIEVSDYTLIFQPVELAGTNRADSIDAGPGPWLGLYAGSSYYSTEYLELLGAEPKALPSLEEAVVTDTGEELELEFQPGCCAESVVAEGIAADELRSVAESLNGLSYDDWRAALGDRLLVDRQTA